MLTEKRTLKLPFLDVRPGRRRFGGYKLHIILLRVAKWKPKFPQKCVVLRCRFANPLLDIDRLFTGSHAFAWLGPYKVNQGR